MDFKLSKEHEMLRKAVQDFAKKKIAPFPWFGDSWPARKERSMIWSPGISGL